jgi:hypothetical protein
MKALKSWRTAAESAVASLNGWGRLALFPSVPTMLPLSLDGTLPRRTVYQDLTPFEDFGPSMAAASTTRARASLVPIVVPEVVRKVVEKKK